MSVCVCVCVCVWGGGGQEEDGGQQSGIKEGGWWVGGFMAPDMKMPHSVARDQATQYSDYEVKYSSLWT